MGDLSRSGQCEPLGRGISLELFTPPSPNQSLVEQTVKRSHLGQKGNNGFGLMSPQTEILSIILKEGKTNLLDPKDSNPLLRNNEVSLYLFFPSVL